MLQVSPKANEMIKEFLKDREEPHSIRIFLTMGCSGPTLGMALDEPQEDDEVILDGGLTFIIEKELLEEAKPIIVDFVSGPMGSGFTLTSSLKFFGGCGGDCGSC